MGQNILLNITNNRSFNEWNEEEKDYFISLFNKNYFLEENKSPKRMNKEEHKILSLMRKLFRSNNHLDIPSKILSHQINTQIKTPKQIEVIEILYSNLFKLKVITF